MEIGIEDCDFSSPPMGLPKVWEERGTFCFESFLCIGALALGSACFRKKRVFTSLANNLFPLEFSEISPPQIDPLTCTEKEKELVEKLFGMVAKTGPEIALPWVAYELYALGKQIHHLHPFALLSTVPQKTMQEIFASSNPLKKSKVLGGIEEGMQRELKRGALFNFLPAFAHKIGKQEFPIKQLILSSDWYGLVAYLFEIPSARGE